MTRPPQVTPSAALEAITAAEKPTMPPDPAGLTRVRMALEQRDPDHRSPVFLELGLPAEWQPQTAAAEPVAAAE